MSVSVVAPVRTGWPFAVFSVLEGSARVGEVDLVESQLLVVRDVEVALEIPPGSSVIALKLPEEAIGPYGASMAAVAGTPVAAAEGTASLVSHLLRGLAQQADGYSPNNPAGVAQHVIGLIALMCADFARSARNRHDEMLERAKEYIESSLGDLDLSPDRIAAALHVSTRTLHRLFEREGLTISGWTRTRRLERCRIDLLNPGHDGESVSSIGTRWGIWDAAHFSRLFKAAYGRSPHAYRVRARQQQALRREPEAMSA
jgi:AraC-like DNA-binding protein